MRGVNPANVISSGSFTSSKSEIKRRNPIYPLCTRSMLLYKVLQSCQIRPFFESIRIEFTQQTHKDLFISCIVKGAQTFMQRDLESLKCDRILTLSFTFGIKFLQCNTSIDNRQG